MGQIIKLERGRWLSKPDGERGQQEAVPHPRLLPPAALFGGGDDGGVDVAASAEEEAASAAA